MQAAYFTPFAIPPVNLHDLLDVLSKLWTIGPSMFVIVLRECHESEEQNIVIWSKRVGKYQYHYSAVYVSGTLVIAGWEVVECTRGVNNAAEYAWISSAMARPTRRLGILVGSCRATRRVQWCEIAHNGWYYGFWGFRRNCLMFVKDKIAHHKTVKLVPMLVNRLDE